MSLLSSPKRDLWIFKGESSRPALLSYTGQDHLLCKTYVVHHWGASSGLQPLPGQRQSQLDPAQASLCSPPFLPVWKHSPSAGLQGWEGVLSYCWPDFPALMPCTQSTSPKTGKEGSGLQFEFSLMLVGPTSQ